MIVIHGFRPTGRRTFGVLCEPLNFFPIWEQPCLEVVLSCMWMESIVVAHPISHLAFRIGCINEFVRAGINVGQGDHVICRIPIVQ